MQNITARSSKLLLMSAFLVSSLVISAPFVRAADMPQSTNILTASDVVANVGVYSITAKAQTGNVLNIGFDVLNRGNVQSSIVYSVSVFKKSNPATPVAQKTYDEDVLHLGTNESIHKNVVYMAPAYLKGDYTVEVNLKTADGLMLAVNHTDTFSLSGSGEGVFVDTQKCYVTVDGADAARYTLSQGVDIATDEALTLHCPITSDFSKNTTVTPVFETRYRSEAGKIIGSEKQAPLALVAGKTIDFTAKLPKVSDPQAYDATLSFVDSNNQLASTVAVVHYVVRGQSATIQNFSLDKTSYVVGDTAKATVVWSGDAGNFPGARKASDVGTKLTRTISVQNDQQQPCTKDISQDIDMNTNGGKEDINIAITAACANPIATVKIAGANGKVLAQNTYTTQAKDAVVTPVNSAANISGGWAQAFIYGAAFLIILILLVYLMKKNNSSKQQSTKKRTQTRMKMFFGLLMGAGMLVSGGQLHAETYPANVWWTLGTNHQQKAPQSFFADLDRSTRVYNLGSRIVPTATMSQIGCDNSFGGKITVTNSADGMTKTLVDGKFVADGSGTDHKVFQADAIPAQDFYAPTKPGTYEMTFILYDYVLSYASQDAAFGACSAYIQLNPAGAKVCGDASGAVPHEIGRAILQYTVDPVLANTLADPTTASCPIIETTANYVCANYGYLDPVTGACGPAGQCPAGTTLNATTGFCANSSLVGGSTNTNTKTNCSPDTANWSPAVDVATLCPTVTAVQTKCAGGVLQHKLLQGKSTASNCSTVWQETAPKP